MIQFDKPKPLAYRTCEQGVYIGQHWAWCRSAPKASGEGAWAQRGMALMLWKAVMNSRWFAQDSLIASFTRRTLTVTTAPIFSNPSRIVFAQARERGPGKSDMA